MFFKIGSMKKLFILLLLVFILQNAFASPKAILERIRNYHPSETLNFDWDGAVMLWGMGVYAQANSQERAKIKADLERYYAIFSKQNPHVSSPDLSAPALGASILKLMGSGKGDLIIQKAQDFILKEPINELGALNHVGNFHRFRSWLPLTRRFVEASIWGDSMIMYVLNGHHVGKATGNQKLLSFIETQPKIFIEHLQHKDGLFRHAYFIKSRELWPVNGSWLRGHGWVMAALVNLIEAGVPGLESAFIKAANATLKYQNKNGLWGTIIEMKNDNEETSGSSLVSFALMKGYRLGLLTNDHKISAQKAWGSLQKKLVKRKIGLGLKDCSGYTNAMPYAEMYRSLIVNSNKETPFCLGSYLLAASELEVK